MRTLIRLAIGLSLSAVAFASPTEEWVWDNYLTPTIGYDQLTGKSSERNTRIVSSWTADDMIIPVGGISITKITWIGLLELEPGAQFTGVDVLIFPAPSAGFPAEDSAVLSSAMSDGLFLQNQSFSRVDRAGQYLYGLQVYDGSFVLPEPVYLSPGHYYYSVRVVGNQRGRNYIATTGNHQRHYEVFPGDPVDTMGTFQSQYFAYPPNTGKWVFVNTVPQTQATDYAYRVYGTPEPASLILVLLGGVTLLRRR